MDNRRTLGNIIRSHRESAGLTQETFAADCHLSTACLCRIERGLRPSLESMVRLSDSLKIPLEELISQYSTDDYKRDGPRRGEDHPRSKLTFEQVKQVREHWKEGMGLRQMAGWIKEQFDVEVSESWVSLVVRNLRHRNE